MAMINAQTIQIQATLKSRIAGFGTFGLKLLFTNRPLPPLIAGVRR
jgi:hypothetical protein